MAEPNPTPTVESITEDWEIRKATYAATLRPRMTPMLDDDGEPIVTKKGETRMRILSFEIPLDLRVGTFDQWTELFTFFGRDPQETFAEIVNDYHKQKQESKKGDARKAVLAEAKSAGLNDKSVTNKALLEKIAGRPKVKKALAEFSAACRTNFPGKPRPATQKKKEKEALDLVQKLEEKQAGIVAKLAAMTPDELAAFMASKIDG